MTAKLDKIEKQIKQLQAQKQAEKAKITQKKRKEDTRRKILAGSYLLDQYKNNFDALKTKLDPFLNRTQDRELFGLAPK